MNRYQDIDWTEFRASLKPKYEWELEKQLKLLEEEVKIARLNEEHFRQKYYDSLSIRIGSEGKAEKVFIELDTRKRNNAKNHSI